MNITDILFVSKILLKNQKVELGHKIQIGSVNLSNQIKSKGSLLKIALGIQGEKP